VKECVRSHAARSSHRVDSSKGGSDSTTLGPITDFRKKALSSEIFLDMTPGFATLDGYDSNGSVGACAARVGSPAFGRHMPVSLPSGVPTSGQEAAGVQTLAVSDDRPVSRRSRSAELTDPRFFFPRPPLAQSVGPFLDFVSGTDLPDSVPIIPIA
jgi:hypothetical protein